MVVDSLISLSFLCNIVEYQVHLIVYEFCFRIQSGPSILRFLLLFQSLRINVIKQVSPFMLPMLPFAPNVALDIASLNNQLMSEGTIVNHIVGCIEMFRINMRWSILWCTKNMADDWVMVCLQIKLNSVSVFDWDGIIAVFPAGCDLGCFPVHGSPTVVILSVCACRPLTCLSPESSKWFSWTLVVPYRQC
jgi:hypothetical protein